MHRLLILGTMGEFVQLVQKAKARGYYTIACDGYPDGPARAYAHENYVLSVTDIDAVATLCKEKNVDGIITSFSDLLLECMVKIADKAGLPCYLKPEQLLWYRDKSATKELLEELGLPTPKFIRLPVAALQDSETLQKAVSSLEFPVVTKPLDKYGSRGIYVIYTLKELMEAGAKTAAFSDLDEILVEEYNDGYEFNMMTWVQNGEVHVISIADREKTEIAKGEIPISTRNVYPSRLYDEVSESATNLLQGFISKTGQTQGALSMQFFWKPDKGIQVCEIAARFFGYEHELTDIVFDFNMEDLLLNYLYDEKALLEQIDKHHANKPNRHGAVIYFQGKLLEIADLSAAVALESHPAVIKPWIFYKEGEAVIAHGPNPYVALYYVAEENREKLDETTQYFIEHMKIPSRDGEEVLYKNQIPLYMH